MFNALKLVCVAPTKNGCFIIFDEICQINKSPIGKKKLKTFAFEHGMYCECRFNTN